MSAPGTQVVVVGGGIAGLAAAYALRTARDDLDVTVLEAGDRLGGKLASTEVGGVRVDVGAEAMLNRRPEAVDLAREVGLGDAIVHPRAGQAAIWTRGAVRPLPPTVMGVPSDLGALRRSGVLSPVGALRAAADLPLPAPRHDVSVADFVRPRLGREVVDRLVEPLLGGVYAGHASTLSLQAAAPQLAALAERGGRLSRAAARSRGPAHDPAEPVFAGLVGGLGRLPDAVARAAGAHIRRRATVRGLTQAAGGAWQLVVGPTTHEELVEADAVVLAVPAAPAARLLGPVVPAAAHALRTVEYASTAIISLAVPPGAFACPPSGPGFLVPPVDRHAIKAVTYSSSKWEWIEHSLEEEVLVLRCSVGRAGEAETLQRDDDELVALAVDDLREATGLRGPLADAHVQRWGGALPQYAVGHRDQVRRVNAAVGAVPGLEVCGAAYRGVGVPAVIESARDAAARILAHLARPGEHAGQ